LAGSARSARGGALGVELEAELGDVAELKERRRHELVLCRGVLHFLDQGRREAAIAALQAASAPGGRNAIAVFDRDAPVPEDLRGLVRSLLGAEELRELYGGWQIERCESRISEDRHLGGIRHRHSILRFTARAPLSGASRGDGKADAA
jgi:hypothetical protein